MQDIPMGKKELAEMLNVERRTAHVWDDRDELPESDYDSINGYKAWNRSTLLLWALRTGRAERMTDADQADAKALFEARAAS